MPDWIKIKNEYINTNISYRKLAEKYNVSFSTLQVRGKKERWKNERDKQCDKVEAKIRQKTADVIVKKEIKQIDRKYELADRLLDKLERAIEELDLSLVTNKRKVRTIEYKDDKAIGKPTKEVIDETEEILKMSGIVDRAGIKQLASALKDIRDVQSEKDDSVGGQVVIVDDF